MEQYTAHHRPHPGHILLLLLLVGVLIFGCCKIIQKNDAEQAALNSGAATETTETQPETTAPVPTETEEQTTEPATFAPIEIPESVQLEVPYISQEGLLPTGCELVSAKMLLEYWSVEMSIDEIIDNTFCAYPVTENGRTYGFSPYDAFIGSPWDETSFGCFPPVVTDMMNMLLPEDMEAVDITGMELAEIAETYLPREMPVLVWATISMLESYPSIGWYLTDENGNPTDEWYEWPANEHCLVLVGYDSENYYFNDPYNSRGLVSYDRDLVETRYTELGKMAVVVMEEQYVQN